MGVWDRPSTLAHRRVLQSSRAPEQFGPRHLHTIKVDVWGFACTFLHMVTGAPPWAGDSVLQICTTVGVGRHAPPLPTDLPPELRQLLGSCLEADPSRRPSATQLLKVREGQGARRRARSLP
jgi:serine/threonine protein kinase